jgi:hypothetical protein
VPSDGGVDRGGLGGHAHEQTGSLVGDHHVPRGVHGGHGSGGATLGLGECGDQFGGAVSSAPFQRALRLGDRVGEPPAGGIGQRGAPAGEVEHRDRLARHHVTHGYARARPAVERLAPVLRAPDQNRAVRLQRGTHPVRAGRGLRPAGPGGEVGVGRSGHRGLVTPAGQDPAGGIGDGHDAVPAFHLPRHGRRKPAQLSQYDVLFERVVTVCRRQRSFGQVRIDPVLLAAAMPGDHHLGPDTPDMIFALHEPLPSRVHGAAGRTRRRGVEVHIAHAEEPPLVRPRRRVAPVQPGPPTARRRRADRSQAPHGALSRLVTQSCAAPLTRRRPPCVPCPPRSVKWADAG